MKIKKSVLTLLITLLITSLFTCNVFADGGGTYYIADNQCLYLANWYSSPWYSNLSMSFSGDDIRLVILHSYYNNEDGYYFQAVSKSSFNYNYSNNSAYNNNLSEGCPLENSRSSRSTTLNGETFYYAGYGAGFQSQWLYLNDNIPVNEMRNGQQVESAIYYAYGDGAIAPAPPRPDYGDLNISYSTKIAGNGQASLQNKDVLDWSVLSSNGYDLSSGAIELRLVPGSYTASTQSNLMSLIYTDFVIDLANAYYLDSVPLSNLSYEMSWEDIISHLNNSTPSYSWLSIQATDGLWLKNGWIWQYRIMMEGEYLTDDYLTIYTSTSSGVSNAENIVNNNYNITLQNTINNINYINNDNSQWYYQDIAIPDYDSSNDSSNWLSTLIEVIGNLLNKLLDLIGGAFSAFTDGIVNLINGLGVDILGVFTNLFNNIFNFLGNLDFTTSEWLLPQSYSDNLEGFTGATNGILSVWFDNGLGLFILIPLVVWLLGVVL